MKKRQIGAIGKSVSAIGLGCWNFAGPYGPTNAGESHETLAAALDCGIDFIDTANVYGMGVSEEVIGSFRDKHRFTIATKAGIRRDSEAGKRFFDNSPEHLRSELENSLTRLGIDCVDLYYIHRRDEDRAIEDVVETLVRFKEEGKIRGFGFSEISPASLHRAQAVHPVSAVQSEYSLWTRQPELGMVQACRALDVAFVAFSPLARGMLTDTLPDPETFADGDFRKGNPRFVEPNFGANLEALRPFAALAADLGTNSAALALAWLLDRDEHVIPIPGTRSAGHLRQCVRACDITLTPETLAEIDRVLPPGFAHGPRYSPAQAIGAESYC